MPERTSYAPGTPSWIDIGTDVDPAKKFYTALFGWETADAEPVEQTGGYGFFRLGGKDVAGYGPKQNPGPPMWTTYISVDDAAATAAAVEDAGGTVVVEPMDVMASGRMAVCIDPTGAFFSLWQPREHIGAGIVNEPGTYCWSELSTRDIEAAKSFYGTVFGWDAKTNPMGESTYTEFFLGGDVVAGMLDQTGIVPDEVPPYWAMYIAVEDCDASVAKVQELGGSVMVPARDIEMGRFAFVSDPQGAVFGLMAYNEPVT